MILGVIHMCRLYVIILLLMIAVHFFSFQQMFSIAKQLHTSMTGAHCLGGIRFEDADVWSSGVNHQLLLRRICPSLKAIRRTGIVDELLATYWPQWAKSTCLAAQTPLLDSIP